MFLGVGYKGEGRGKVKGGRMAAQWVGVAEAKVWKWEGRLWAGRGSRLKELEEDMRPPS